MSSRDEGRFRPKVGPPRSRGSGRSPFAKQVLAQVFRAGSASRSGLLKPPSSQGARLGRGHVAAKFAGQSLTSRARRVVIKSRLVVFEGRGRQSTEDYDAKRAEGTLVDLCSELSITQQVRAIGVTWLDRQLVGKSEVLETVSR